MVGQRESFFFFFFGMNREKMNYIYNLGTHTINIFGTQLIPESVMQFHMATYRVHYYVYATVLCMGQGDREESVNLE